MGFKTENKAANVIKNKFILSLILVKRVAKITLFIVLANINNKARVFVPRALIAFLSYFC